MAVNGAPCPIQPRNTPICSSQTSNSRFRGKRRWRSSEGSARISKSIPSALMVPSTKKRVRSYSLQDSVSRRFAMSLRQSRFDFVQQNARLLAWVVGRDARDDCRQPRRSIIFQQTHALFRRVEDGKKVRESFSRLVKKLFHPAPTFRLRTLNVGLKVKRYVERAGMASIGAPVLGGVLIDLTARRGKSFQGRCQRHPAVAQATDALESVFVSVGDNPDRNARALRRMRQNPYIV